jgi:hypothetical protein
VVCSAAAPVTWVTLSPECCSARAAAKSIRLPAQLISRSQQQRELSQPAKGKAARRFPCTRVPPTRHRTAGAPVYTHLRGDAPVARCISRRGAPSCGMNWCTLRGRPPRSVYLFHDAALINFLFVCNVPPVGRPALAVFYVYWPALQARAHAAAGVFFGPDVSKRNSRFASGKSSAVRR